MTGKLLSREESVMCTWSDKSHKLCSGNCEDGCQRKLAYDNNKDNPWEAAIAKLVRENKKNIKIEDK